MNISYYNIINNFDIIWYSFSKNDSTNIGILDIQEINVEMNYIPIQ